MLLLQCDKKDGGWDDKDDAQYEVLYKPADENDVKNNYDQKENYDFKDDYDDDADNYDEDDDDTVPSTPRDKKRRGPQRALSL